VRSTSPNFADWRELPSIKIWEIAALMQGFDPRALDEVAVRDPEYPTSPNGIPPDLSWEIRRLTSAVKAGGLVTAPIGVFAPDDETEIEKTSLVDWLRTQGYVDLADELDTSSLVNEPPAATSPVAVPINGTAVVWTPERILEARTMRDNAKANGVRAYAANTAKYFDVSTARLREVLSDKTETIEAQKPAFQWPPTSR
jgi:hypothetical protein